MKNSAAHLLASLGIIITIILHFWGEFSKENYTDEALRVTSCLNWKKSGFIVAGKGHDWNYLERYNTEIYFNNLNSLLNNYSASTTLKRGFITTIHNMEAANKILDQHDYQVPLVKQSEGPYAALVLSQSIMNDEINSSIRIKNNLESLGFNATSCEDILF